MGVGSTLNKPPALRTKRRLQGTRCVPSQRNEMSYHKHKQVARNRGEKQWQDTQPIRQGRLPIVYGRCARLTLIDSCP